MKQRFRKYDYQQIRNITPNEFPVFNEFLNFTMPYGNNKCSAAEVGATVKIKMDRSLHIFIFLGAVSISNAMPFLNMTRCPTSTPQRDIDIDQVLGKWYLASLFFHETVEDVEIIKEEAACMKAEISKENSTFINQVWAIHSPTKNTGMVFELPTILDTPGTWTVISPLGVPLHVTVVHALPKSHMVLVFCAGEKQLQYLWTAVLTRKMKLSHFDHVLSSIITGYGFDSTGQLPTWHYCLPTVVKE